MNIRIVLASLFLLGSTQAMANEETFAKLDVDSSGTISAEEAVAIEGLQESMAEYDLNGDRELDPKEFALFVESMEAKSSS